MDFKQSQINSRNRFLKLSLKKSRVKDIETRKKSEQTADVVTLDESFDRLQMEFTNRIQKPKLNSPIVIDDSCELSESEELSKTKASNNEPSKAGNISLNLTKEGIALSPQESRPCGEGWSPVQHFICATPKHCPTPSTPKDIVNESLEQCSVKKIQQSQIKLLNDLYGDTWKTIPKLFKNISNNKDKFDCISKKLFDDDDSDKENIKNDLKREKLLYLTGSDAKHKSDTDCSRTDKKCKKKLYTEKIPHTPDLPKTKPKTDRAVNSTTKKIKGLTVTELVKVKKNEVEKLTKKVGDVTLESPNALCKRLSFVGSLADNVPSWRCHLEAIQYIDNFKTLKVQLAHRLYTEFNKVVFSDALDKDLPILWEPKLRKTAGTTTNRLIKNANGVHIRTSSIKLSTKVVDGPQRLRDTLIHELCHVATWLIDGVLRAGHGPLWKKWVADALRAFPELKEITRCHNMDIHSKYSYRCTDCGYRIQRDKKSIDITKKCCGYCRGKFEVILNKKNKDGVVVSTPARKGTPNEFALYVKDNYRTLKDGKTHAEVMKLLGEQFSARKRKPNGNIPDTDI